MLVEYHLKLSQPYITTAKLHADTFPSHEFSTVATTGYPLTHESGLHAIEGWYQTTAYINFKLLWWICKLHKVTESLSNHTRDIHNS